MKHKAIFIAGLIGVVTGYIIAKHIDNKEIGKAYMLSEKNKYLYRTAVQWMSIERAGCGICSYIRQKGYNTIAVYGLSYLGKCLVDQLDGSDVKVMYGIDNGTVQFHFDIPTFTMSDELPDVDAIIVTPVYSFEEIKESLSKKVTCSILSLADIVFER